MSASSGDGGALDLSLERGAFGRALATDLDTPTAALALEWAAHRILAAAERGADVRLAQQALREMAGVLGLTLDQQRPQPEVKEGWEHHRKRFATTGPA